MYFRLSDPVYKRLYRKKSSQPNKMPTKNKTKNRSRINIIEVASSCCGSLYELYRRKVHPATLAVSAQGEFLNVPQQVRPQSHVSQVRTRWIAIFILFKLKPFFVDQVDGTQKLILCLGLSFFLDNSF